LERGYPASKHLWQEAAGNKEQRSCIFSSATAAGGWKCQDLRNPFYLQFIAENFNQLQPAAKSVAP